MSQADELIKNAKNIRQRLMYPPNAVLDRGINLTRQSTAYKGDIPPPDTPTKKPLVVRINPPPSFVFPLNFEDIVIAVAAFYEIPVEEIKGERRFAVTCLARRVIVYLGIKLLKRSLSSIGRDLNKDHTSILHARDRINEILLKDPILANEISMIEQVLVPKN